MRFHILLVLVALVVSSVPSLASAESFGLDVGTSKDEDAGVSEMDAASDVDAGEEADAGEEMDAGEEEPDAPEPVGMDAGERVDAPGPPPGSGVRCAAGPSHASASLSWVALGAVLTLGALRRRR